MLMLHVMGFLALLMIRGIHLRMATTPLSGAGMSGKSKRLNSPGESGIAKIIECCFHCNRSSIPSSLKQRTGNWRWVPGR